MNNNIPVGLERGRISVAIILWDFAVLWYYFFSASIILRPFASAIWITLVVLGFFIFNIRVIKLEKYFSLCLLSIFVLFVSSAYSIDTNTSLKYSFSFLLYLIVAYEISSNRDNVYVFIRMAIPFIIAHCVIMIIQIVRPDLYQTVFLPLLPNTYRYRILGFMRRGAFTGFTNQTSSIADILSLSIGILIFQMKNKNGYKKLWYIVFTIVCILLLGLTERRWSTIVVLFLILLAISTLIKKRAIKTTILLIGVILVFTGVISSLSSTQSIVNKMIFEVNAGDVTNGRQAIWAQTVRYIIEKPFTGYGANTFQSLIPSEANAHNSYLQAWLELGLVGAIVFFIPFIYGFFRTIKYYKIIKTDNSQDMALVFFSIYWQVYCLLDAVFESFFTSELSVFMLFFAQMLLFNETMFRGKEQIDIG